MVKTDFRESFMYFNQILADTRIHKCHIILGLFLKIPVMVCYEGRFGFLSLQPNPAFTTTLHCSVAGLSRQLAALAFRKHRQQ